MFIVSIDCSYLQDMLVDEMNGTHGSDTEDSEDDLPEIDLSSGNKDTSVLEVNCVYNFRIRKKIHLIIIALLTLSH